MFFVRDNDIKNIKIDYFDNNLSVSDDNLQIPFEYFREFNYTNSIESYLNICMKYLIQQMKNKPFIKSYEIKSREIAEYVNLFHTQVIQYIIEMTDINDNKTTFMKLNFLKLIDKAHFLINGNYYVPSVYITDYPITAKKKSIILFALFNPITLYLADNRVIFTGVNIPLKHFLNIFLEDNDFNNTLITNICNAYKTKLNNFTLQETLQYFEKKLRISNCKREDVIKYFERLFFDEYTSRLYKKIYNLTSLSEIVKYSFINALENDISFIDLKYKRLIFSEIVLEPLFDKFASLAVQFGNGFTVSEISSFDLNTLLKHFNTGLEGNYIYDTVNLFSCLLQYKCSMVKPKIKEVPAEVAQLHETHFGRICPITVSSQNPGRTVFIVPDTKIDEFGSFI